ncbi:putative Histone-like nucleoid-structuring protein H-NS [Cupriavidus taiwanensis]|uniref:Putative Histone-like nucleoid-structuring protein H-NS n=1 Tax=Cupriavidus taiwanensis TaxID=164546 RepID=A0A375JG46_9BURK|nr:putative Histone-like nucleoid-structuring protein H-NS [Cupriavidus taiwanensis]
MWIWAREFLKLAWDGQGPSGTNEAKAHGVSDKASPADAVTSSKNGYLVPVPRQLSAIVTRQAHGFGELESPSAGAKLDANRGNVQASGGDYALDIVDDDAVSPRRPGSGHFWSLTRDSGTTTTVSYRRRRRLHAAPEVLTKALAPEVLTEVAAKEVPPQVVAPQAPTEVEVPTRTAAPEAPVEAPAPKAPTEAAAAEVRRQEQQRRKLPTEATALGVPAQASAPEVPTQATAPKVQIEVMEAHKELVEPKARPQAGAPARRTRAVAPKALKSAVSPVMPTEKPRTPKAATYQGLLAQMAAVDAQIEKLRAELPGVVEKIQRLMRDYDLSIDDIAIKQRRGHSMGTETAQPKATLPAKYLNPKTGQTWSGRGRAPAWLGKRPERFMIAAE